MGEKLNICNKLKLLSRFLSISSEDFEAKCRKLIRESPAGTYKSESSVKNLFRTVRHDGKPSTGAKEVGIDPKDVALVDAVVRACLAPSDLHLTADLRLDAPLSDFLHGIGCSVADAVSNSAKTAQELVSYVNEFSIPKSSFLAESAILSNRLIASEFDLPRYYSVVRFNSRSADDFPMVEEKIELTLSSVPRMYYRDFQGVEFYGVPIISNEKIIASCVSTKSSLSSLAYTFISIFLQPLTDNEFLASIQRSGAGEPGCSNYRAVCIARHADFEVVKKIGPIDGRQIKYGLVLDNTQETLSPPQTSHEVSYEVARKNLYQGIAMLKTYREHYDEFRATKNTRKLMHSLERLLGQA